MKRNFENGNVVPITVGKVKAVWPESPTEQRMREEGYFPLYRVGALAMKAQCDEAQAIYKQKRFKKVLDLLNGLGV